MSVVRIVTVDLRTHVTHEYAYVLDNPAVTGTAVSEIAALSATRFVLGALVSATAPDGSFYNHDKVEGLAILRGGRKIIISNDSDFGVAGSQGSTPPYTLVAKTAPDGSVDTGEFLVIDRG